GPRPGAALSASIIGLMPQGGLRPTAPVTPFPSPSSGDCPLALSPGPTSGRMSHALAGPGRPEILYLVHRFPYPPNKGDRIRAFPLLKHLAEMAAVHLACLADEPVDAQAVHCLESLCARVAVVPLRGPWRWARALGSVATCHTASEGAFSTPALRDIVRTWANQTRFAACLASASSMAPSLRLPGLRDVPAAVDLVDVDSQKWLDYARATSGPRGWLYRVEGSRLRRLERDLAGWARAITVVSEAEAQI